MLISLLNKNIRSDNHFFNLKTCLWLKIYGFCRSYVQTVKQNSNMNAIYLIVPSFLLHYNRALFHFHNIFSLLLPFFFSSSSKLFLQECWSLAYKNTLSFWTWNCAFYVFFARIQQKSLPQHLWGKGGQRGWGRRGCCCCSSSSHRNRNRWSLPAARAGLHHCAIPFSKLSPAQRGTLQLPLAFTCVHNCLAPSLCEHDTWFPSENVFVFMPGWVFR